MISQYGQDQFVVEALSGMRGGFFIDSGASDGVKFSNTLLLEQSFGWNGICVEPNDKFFASLLANRSCRCINTCLYDRDGSAEFVEDALVLGGILSEYDPSHLRYACASYDLDPNGLGRPDTVTKQTRTLYSILQEYDAPSVIDYWSLDTEGSELALLRSFPFDKYVIRAITVEHNWLPDRVEIRQFLASRGYLFVRELGCDDCYVRHEDAANLAPRDKKPAWRSAAFRD